MTTVTCPVCSEDFNDSRPPIILKCGHSFCKPCISKIIANSNAGTCPVCKRIIDYKSSDDIPTNYILLELLIKIDKKVDSKDDVATNSTSETMCSLHQCKINKWCETCNDCLCASCCSSELDCPHPPSKCSVIDLEPMDLIKSSLCIKGELMKMLQELQSKVEYEKSNFDYCKTTMNQKRAKIECDLKGVEGKKLHLMKVQSKLSSFREKVMEKNFVCDPSKVSGTLVDYLQQKSLKNEIHEWREDTLEGLPISTEMTSLQQYCYITQNSYVVITKNYKSLYGKVRFYGDSLFISNFKTQTPVFPSNVFQLTDICKDEDFKDQLVYLEVKIENLEKIVLTISLYETNDFASNFFLLCSGIGGPSYEGCRFTGTPDGFVSGCYEDKVNDIGAAAVQYIDESTCEKQQWISIGDIYAPHPSSKDLQSRFVISTNVNSNRSGMVFGKVVADKNSFESWNYYGSDEVGNITDCGVIVKC